MFIDHYSESTEITQAYKDYFEYFEQTGLLGLKQSCTSVLVTLPYMTKIVVDLFFFIVTFFNINLNLRRINLPHSLLLKVYLSLEAPKMCLFAVQLFVLLLESYFAYLTRCLSEILEPGILLLCYAKTFIIYSLLSSVRRHSGRMHITAVYVISVAFIGFEFAVFKLLPSFVEPLALLYNANLLNELQILPQVLFVHANFLVLALLCFRIRLIPGYELVVPKIGFLNLTDAKLKIPEAQVLLEI